MHSAFTRVLLAAAASALPLAPAHAITCYVVYDRNDNAIFQDTYPPVDLSDRGKAEREAMYKRGQQLIIMEAERCPTIQFLTGSGGNVNLSVDEIVAGLKPAPTPAGSGGKSPAGGAAAGSAAPARPAAPTKASPKGY